jgi:hypothetical protein
MGRRERPEGRQGRVGARRFEVFVVVLRCVAEDEGDESEIVIVGRPMRKGDRGLRLRLVDEWLLRQQLRLVAALVGNDRLQIVFRLPQLQRFLFNLEPAGSRWRASASGSDWNFREIRSITAWQFWSTACVFLK